MGRGGRRGPVTAALAFKIQRILQEKFRKLTWKSSIQKKNTRFQKSSQKIQSFKLLQKYILILQPSRHKRAPPKQLSKEN